MRFNIASDLHTRQTVWVITYASGKQSAQQVGTAELAGIVQQDAYDRHGAARLPRCPISGWSSTREV